LPVRGPRAPIRRLTAGTIDLVAGVVLGILLSNTPVGDFFARRAVVMLRIGAPDTIWKGPVPMLMGIAGRFVYVLPLALLAVSLCEPVWGGSPGDAMLGLASGTRADLSGPCGRRWRRTLVNAAPWWGLTLALLTGSWVLALVFALVGLTFLGRAAFSFLTSSFSRS
jgi:hypothetical protein